MSQSIGPGGWRCTACSCQVDILTAVAVMCLRLTFLSEAHASDGFLEYRMLQYSMPSV